VASLVRERGASLSVASDPEVISYPDQSFDAVLSAFGVIYAERRDDAVAEVFRVTRPDGMVSLAAWTRAGFMGAWLGLAGRHALPASAPDVTEWGRAQTMRAELEPFAGDDAAFNAEVVTLRFASPGAAWLAFSHLPGPVTAAIERLDEDAREAMRLEFNDLLPAPAGADPAVDVDVRVQLIAARAA
jgi:SAM-dependent methyltransferase